MISRWLFLLTSVPVAALSLSAAHAGGAGARPQPKQKVTAVIDRTVNDRVVERTVVVRLGNERSARTGAGAAKRAKAASGRGWSVTEGDASLPTDLTLGGRLQEVDSRTRGNVTTIRLRSPSAAAIPGPRETRVYTRGRLVRARKRDAAATAPKGLALSKRPAAGTPMGITTPAGSVEYLEVGGPFEVVPDSVLSIDVLDPESVVFTAPKTPKWVFSRAEIANAAQHGLARLKSANPDVTYQADGEYLNFDLQGADGRSGILRVKLSQVRDLLARAAHIDASQRVDMDAAIEGLLRGD